MYMLKNKNWCSWSLLLILSYNYLTRDRTESRLCLKLLFRNSTHLYICFEIGVVLLAWRQVLTFWWLQPSLLFWKLSMSGKMERWNCFCVKKPNYAWQGYSCNTSIQHTYWIESLSECKKLNLATDFSEIKPSFSASNQSCKKGENHLNRRKCRILLTF